MLILTIRTDKPEAEIGLYDGQLQIGYQTWTAHRELGKTILGTITALLNKHGKDLHELEGLIAFQGPGSFTGLRIGLTVANTLAYSLKLPIVGQQGEDWIQQGVSGLLSGHSDHVVLPEYGAEANITQPRK